MYLHRKVFAVILLFVLLASCAPLASPSQLPGPIAATQAPPEPTQALAPAPDEPALTQSLAPITLTAPPMQVGSLYRYFDGTLLDAVPNEGPFMMGPNGADNPQHEVTVDDFWIYSTEVTNQMYAWCVSLGKCSPPSAAANRGYGDPRQINNPVVGVDWQQASEYCGFAHGRLPTEAEWEKAARWDARLKLQRLYPWGDRRPTCDLANYKNCLLKSAPVTDYGRARSFYGALNMAGNVYEWVNDWYGAGYYASSPAQNPQGPESGSRRAVRSSAFGSDGYVLDPAWRSSAQPGDQRADLGFRCVVQDPMYFAPYCSVPVFYAVTSAGGTDLGQTCGSPTVEQAGYCGRNKTPVVNVKIHSSPPTVVTITGLESCSPGTGTSNEAHQCPQGTQIEIQASCPLVPAGSPACAPNYILDPNNPDRCVSPGSAGACPDGFQYDDSLKCCSAVPGNAAAAPLCAVGQRLYNGICVDDASGPREPTSLTVVADTGVSCTP